jgi:hypothetical protein
MVAKRLVGLHPLSQCFYLVLASRISTVLPFVSYLPLSSGFKLVRYDFCVACLFFFQFETYGL